MCVWRGGVSGVSGRVAGVMEVVRGGSHGSGEVWE